MPRRRYAGTYDAKWMEERAPLLPLDFDERFYNAAPPPLVAPGRLAGGEPVEVTGCTPQGRLVFTLPRVAPWCHVVAERVGRTAPMELDTVTVDTEAMQVRLLWKAEIPVHGEAQRVTAITCTFEGRPA